MIIFLLPFSPAVGGLKIVSTDSDCGKKCIAEMPEGYAPKKGFMHSLSSEEETGLLGQDKKSTIANTNNFIQSLVEKIPSKDLRTGLKEYLKIVKPEAYENDSSVGVGNAGIQGYFNQRFSKNQCFQNAAKDFYKEVETTLAKQGQGMSPKSASQVSKSNKTIKPNFCMVGCSPSDYDFDLFDHRPSLDEQAGQGSKSSLPEGWLLKLAMKHSNGNPEAALEMIGMCGHDDVNQGTFKYIDKSETALANIREDLEKAKKLKATVDENLKKEFKKSHSDPLTVEDLTWQQEHLANSIAKLQKADGKPDFLECPSQSSDFFLQGSLSAEADISKALKNEIKSVQGDGKKEKPIPSKHYHVYASALLGCKLVNNGMSPSQAVTVQTTAARMYRGVRICEASKGLSEKREKLEQNLQVKNIENSKEVEAKVLELWNQKNQGAFKCGKDYSEAVSNMFEMLEKLHASVKDKKTGSSSKNADTTKCKVLRTFHVSQLQANERDIVLKKIKTGMARLDAAKLYKSWYFGGPLAGVSFPCTDIRNRGPADLMKPNEGILGNFFRPSNWSKERYEAASKQLATWDIDFKWTIAEHEAGSKFGAKLCSGAKNKRNPFEDATCNQNSAAPTVGSPANQPPSTPKTAQ